MRKFLSAMLAAVMLTAITAAAATAVSAADIESELIGYYKLDGNLNNEIGSDKAQFIGQGLTGTFDEEPMFEPGYKSTAFYAMSGVGDGLKLDAAPQDNTYTVSIWAKAETCGFAAPIIWIGSESHIDASYDRWLGVWADFDGASWSTTPSIGSNDEVNSKVGAVPEEGLSADGTFGWTLITLTVDNGVGTLYYNGEEAANTVDDFARSLPGWGSPDGATELPTMFGADGYDDTAIYLAANAWDAPPTMYFDEVRVYDRVLTSDDVAELYASYDGTVPADEDPSYSGDETELNETEPNLEPGDETTEAPDVTEDIKNAGDTSSDDGKNDGSGDDGSGDGSDSSVVIWVVFGVVWVVLIAAIIVIIIKRRK